MDLSWVKQEAGPWQERYSRVSVMCDHISTPGPLAATPTSLIATDSYHVSPARMPWHLSQLGFVLSRSGAPRPLLRPLPIKINDWPFAVERETKGKGQTCRDVGRLRVWAKTESMVGSSGSSVGSLRSGLRFSLPLTLQSVLSQWCTYESSPRPPGIQALWCMRRAETPFLIPFLICSSFLLICFLCNTALRFVW